LDNLKSHATKMIGKK